MVKSPGVPADAAAIARARGRGLPVIGELELAWRLLPNRFCAVTGTNGKTTVTELLGHVWRTAGEPVAVAGNVGTPLASLVGEIDARGDDHLRGLELPARGHRRLRARVRGAAQRRPRPSRPPRRPRRLPGGEAADVRQPGQTTTSCVYNGSDPALRGRDLGGCGRRIAFCRRPGDSDDCQATIVGPVLELWGEPLLETGELALLGPAQRRERGRRGRRRRGAGDRARRDRRRPAQLHRASRTGSSGSARSAASSTSTTRRRPTSPRRARRLRSFDGGVRAILGGSLKGGGFAELAAPVARALRRLLPDRRGGRAARARPRAGLGAPGSSTAAATASPRPCAAAAADAAAGRGRAARARLRQLRRLPRLRGTAASTSASLVGELRMSPSAQGRLALDRVLAAADRDALPARLRRGHGLQRQLDHLAAGRVGRRRLLPQAHGRLRRPRAGWSCACSRSAGSRLLRPLTPLVLAVAFFLCLVVLVPGIGIEVNGSRAWIGAGPLQIQPSELMKIALILFARQLLATRPEIVKGGLGRLTPVLGVVGAGVADRRRRRPRHGAGHLPRDRRAAGRRRGAAARHRPARRRRRRAWSCSRC